MKIQRAFKSRLLFVVTAILLVFTATSALAAKTTNSSPESLKGVWVGQLQTKGGDKIQFTLNITDVELDVGDRYNISTEKIIYTHNKKSEIFDKGNGFIHAKGRMMIIYAGGGYGSMQISSGDYDYKDKLNVKVSIIRIREGKTIESNGTLSRKPNS